MPKKHRNTHFTKPPSTSHHSLATCAHPPSSSTSSSSSSSPSVNELLAQLRHNPPRTPEQISQIVDLATARTVHPSLKQILQVAEVPPPRPRPGMLSIRSRRGPAGPAPPSSWLIASQHCPRSVRKAHVQQIPDWVRPINVNRLPGSSIVRTGSLLDQSLRAMARNWTWNVDYDQNWLATLPTNMKSVLLSYISVYGPNNGLTLAQLKVLMFDSEELPGGSGSEDLLRLDLSGSIGRGVTLSQLQRYFNKHALLETPSTPSDSAAFPDEEEEEEEEEDDWEKIADRVDETPQCLVTARFPTLTYLSLSHPHPEISWARLLDFASHLATLTHLSLAHWPVPTLTPNSKTAVTSSKYSPSVSYGGTDFYSAAEGDWSEAAGILRRLSRATYCLKWLDLEGCNEWLPALSWGEEGRGAEWLGGWRRVETVIVKQGWTPDEEPTETYETRKDWQGVVLGSPDHDWRLENIERIRYQIQMQRKLWRKRNEEARNLEKFVRTKRSARGGAFVTFIHDDESEGES